MALTRDKRNLLFGVGILLITMALFQFVSYGTMMDKHDSLQERNIRRDDFFLGSQNVSLALSQAGEPRKDSETDRLLSQQRELSLGAEVVQRSLSPPALCKDALCTFLDISINSSSVGRIVFLLHEKQRKKTVENFKALSTGEKGLSSSGTKLHYKGTTFSRVVHNILVQGGDIHDGRASDDEKDSIYGKAFEHEGLDELHERGLLAMAGPQKGGSEFFITLDSVAELDNQYVVFGEVVEGMNVVDQINQVMLNADGEPILPVVISDCGQL